MERDRIPDNTKNQLKTKNKRFYNMFGTFTKKRFVYVSFEHCYNIINVL